MINITIKTKEEKLFKELLPSANMQPAEDPGELSFCLPADQFKVFYQEVKSLGLDPFLLMTWSNARRSKQCSKLSLPLIVISEEEPINKPSVVQKVKALTT